MADSSARLSNPQSEIRNPKSFYRCSYYGITNSVPTDNTSPRTLGFAWRSAATVTPCSVAILQRLSLFCTRYVFGLLAVGGVFSLAATFVPIAVAAPSSPFALRALTAAAVSLSAFTGGAALLVSSGMGFGAGGLSVELSAGFTVKLPCSI